MHYLNDAQIEYSTTIYINHQYKEYKGVCNSLLDFLIGNARKLKDFSDLSIIWIR